MNARMKLAAGAFAALGVVCAPDWAASQIPLPLPVPGLGGLIQGQLNKAATPQAASDASDASRDAAACEAGGALGGMLGGSILSKTPLGSQLASAGGCLVARQIARELTKNERAELQSKTEAIFDDPTPSETYQSEDSHKTVTLTRGDAAMQPKTWQIDALADVTPPHDGFNVVGKTYFARKKVNLRAFTSTSGEIIGSFKPNEAVFVMGRTYDGAWNLIGYDNVLVGYASTDLFSASPLPPEAAKAKPAAKPALAKGSVTDAAKAKVTVSTNTTCSQVAQQVGNAKGTITGCKSPNGGWDLA